MPNLSQPSAARCIPITNATAAITFSPQNPILCFSALAAGAVTMIDNSGNTQVYPDVQANSNLIGPFNGFVSTTCANAILCDIPQQFAAATVEASSATSLTTALSSETSSRSSADTSLTSSVSGNTSAESSLTTSVSSRTSADTSLTSSVSANLSTSTSAQTSLTSALSTTNSTATAQSTAISTLKSQELSRG